MRRCLCKTILSYLEGEGYRFEHAGPWRWGSKKLTCMNMNLLSIKKKEFDLLLFFISNQGRVLTKKAIAEHLWEDFADSSDSFDFVYSLI
jgi:DNA-binding response OmpR family regulator